MARQQLPVEINTFTKGIITEASPINFPENASLDEENFILFKDGSRKRRLGLDYETNYTEINTGLVGLPEEDVIISSYLWNNAGGNSAKKIVVVQSANVVKFFDIESESISIGLIHTYTAPTSTLGNRYSFTTVDGILVLATGNTILVLFEYNNGTITQTAQTLKIRDLFGVEDIETETGDDLRDGSNIMKRPASLTEAHTYNLRNQTWALPRIDNNNEHLEDTIKSLFETDNKYPSNADSVNTVLYPDANDADNRTQERFFSRELIAASTGASPAPLGFFIIDALNRGSSRLEEAQKLYERETDELGLPILEYLVENLPEDRTTGGATAVEEFAGRVWYAGFSGDVVDGDAHSPRLSSYILYSRLVDNISDINKCYQEADPTSKDISDLVATDGGFIRIDNAYNIVGLKNISSSILVLAENGVWQISGGSDYGFSADNNLVRKITDKGCISAGSIVEVEGTVFYWGSDAIYHIAPDQFGSLQASNITSTTIKTLYDNISTLDKSFSDGEYNSYERKISWVYGNRLESTEGNFELVFDLDLTAFYKSAMRAFDTGFTPILCSPIELPPLKPITVVRDVVYNGELVTYNGDQVVFTDTKGGTNISQVFYVVITDTTSLSYTFAEYSDTDFLDWKSYDTIGVDADAYVLTGWTSGGENQRHKGVSWLTFYMRATETGYELDGTGNIVPVNPSSCLLQSRWDWANSIVSNKWGRELQMYRRKRHFIPVDENAAFDDGFEIVATKSKLRGRGRSLSLYLKTEAGKDCNILGWALILGVNNNV